MAWNIFHNKEYYNNTYNMIDAQKDYNDIARPKKNKNETNKPILTAN